MTQALKKMSYESQTKCGRCSCVIVYSSERCVLCDAALEVMYSVLDDFGLPPESIRVVDIDSEISDCGVPAPLGLPAMRVCDEFITGLPDIDMARGAIMSAVLRACFTESCSLNNHSD
ncbi:MAG: hypothetical protein ACFFCP_10220 [Promethearchaeota archaeon]